MEMSDPETDRWRRRDPEKAKQSARRKEQKRSSPAELSEGNMPRDFLRRVEKKGIADDRNSSDGIHDLLQN
jgi:hypothetical protein